MSKEINIDHLIEIYTSCQIGEIFCMRMEGKVEKLNVIRDLLQNELDALGNREFKKTSLSTKIGLRMYDRATKSLNDSFAQKMKKLQGFVQNENLREIIADYEKTDDKFDLFCNNITKNVLENVEKSVERDGEVARAMLQYNLLSVEKAIEQLNFHNQYFTGLKNESEQYME